MKKYTANYAWTNPNFVIQNLAENSARPEYFSLLCVLKNILQRGFPTTLSSFLQTELGPIHKSENFDERFLLASCKTPVWSGTIKGDKDRNYYPAKDFFERIIPNYFGDYAFVKSLVVPEIGINDLVGEPNNDFINQQVDFYLPQAKMVIEIDGQQHKLDNLTRVSDNIRDNYLSSKGITTFRITTRELSENRFQPKIDLIVAHLSRFEKLFLHYRNACYKHETGTISASEYKTKLLPTAVIRFQILLIELLKNDYLNFTDEWKFNIICEDGFDEFAELAVKDVFIWLEHLWKLRYKSDLKKPGYEIELVNKAGFNAVSSAINVDFSLFNKYTDEHELNTDIIYVRGDYFDNVKERNYFRVSTTDPVNYKISAADEEPLTFFLQNIFGKASFMDGQFAIIENALNRRDTIGLLPTGGGKSLCYQLPCMLQPSVNFVVCPIKSLMYDQDENLKKMLITNVAYITGDLDGEERREVEVGFELGRYLFVWISPEKLQIPSFRDKIRSITVNFSIAYAVIDEVHCLSEWGHDFRTSYLNLAKTIERLSPKETSGEGVIKFIGLTATASVNVLKDIRIEFSRQKQQLENENIKSLLDYSRKELDFEVLTDSDNKTSALENLLKDLVDDENLTETKEKAAIIFTPNVNGGFGCYSVSNHINTHYPHKSNWYSGEVPKIDQYDDHGRKTGKAPVMTPQDFVLHKTNVQRGFKNNDFPIMVATKAFGMGIDKSNIFYTVHFGLPSSVEALYQEAGRAGRWDKRLEENEGLRGKCFVLYSPETHDAERVQRLFQQDTSFAEMKEISEEVKFNGKDLFKQIFLFIQGQNDIREDFEITKSVIRQYYQPDVNKLIFWDDAWQQLHIDKNTLQKAIYRLSLLGIAADWSTNFVNHYEVEFKKYDDESVVRHVAAYVNKYEPDRAVGQEIRNVPKPNVTEQALWYMLNWIFENIAHNRKQSLKTLVDWCNEFDDSATFKRRIDNYFKFTEVTFILQHIAANPRAYQQWFAALTIIERDHQNAIKNEIYLPGIEDELIRCLQFENLRDSISRFLESSGNNTGLNFLSGLVRLFLDQYNDSDGIGRFESAIETISKDFPEGQQEEILKKLLLAGEYLTAARQEDLCRSLLKFYPDKLEFLAGYYDLDHLLNERYEALLMKIKNLNKRLHEQLEEI